MKHPYDHTQSVASSTWTIIHDLGRYPAIDVYTTINGDTQKIMPLSIVYDSPNQVTVSFTSARAGTARLF